jgi:hypothetical protein
MKYGLHKTGAEQQAAHTKYAAATISWSRWAIKLWNCSQRLWHPSLLYHKSKQMPSHYLKRRQIRNISSVRGNVTFICIRAPWHVTQQTTFPARPSPPWHVCRRGGGCLVNACALRTEYRMCHTGPPIVCPTSKRSPQHFSLRSQQKMVDTASPNQVGCNRPNQCPNC